MVQGVGEKKVKWAREFSCPHCGFQILIETGKIIEKPGIKAQFREYTDIKKSDQTKLESEKTDSDN